jgi:hypothetical protein
LIVHTGQEYRLKAFDIEEATKESVWTKPGEMRIEAQDLRPSLNIIIFKKSRKWRGMGM